MPFAPDRRRLIALLALLSAVAIYSSQQKTLYWDEGFHLVAAMMVAAGKRPYVDFCFPQPPLHAYWNALWVHLAPGSWRVPQTVAALLSCGAMVLMADYVYRCFRKPAWQLTSACAAALLIGLNAVVLEFGTSAQAYGAGLLLTVAAFRCVAENGSSLRALIAGVLAGAAASCTLLSAPVGVVLFLWTVWERRWREAAAFAAGCVLGTAPVSLALMEAPYATWFNLVQYHTAFRYVGWTGAGEHDLQVLASWVDSGQALILGVFAVAGVFFVRDRRLYLPVFLAAGVAAEAAVAHPTFPQYFIFMVPFLAIPAAVGLSEVACRVFLPQHWALLSLAGIMLLSLTNSAIEIREDNNTWDTIEALKTKIEEVTPPNGRILADPPVYFALRRVPPPGMEFPASHRVELPAREAQMLHIVSQADLERSVKSGEFDTAESCKEDEEEIQSLRLPKIYAHSFHLGGCSVYWGITSGR